MKSNINQKSSRYGIATIPNLNGSAPPQPTYEELGERQDSSYASPTGPLMKAVLEFTYPQDERKLEHALKGEKYFEALCEIDNILAEPRTKAETVSLINKILDDVLGEA
jgi:hypothetical protein